MNGLQNFGADKFMERMFRKADNVVWDLMTGKIGVRTSEGIATLEGSGDDAQININLFDEFGMSVPAFAQSTPLAAVNVGDIIFFGKTQQPGWVVDKTIPSDPAKSASFSLMKVDGTRSSWKPPKVSMLGFESGVMVLRSLVSMLPGGASGVQNLQGMMLPLMMAGGDMDMDKMMPMMLMSQMGAQAVNPDGTTTNVAPMGNNMMQMMLMMQMMKSMNGDSKSSMSSSKNNFFKG